MTLFWHRMWLVIGACALTTTCFGVVAAAAVMVETVGHLTRAEGGAQLAASLWALAVLECAYQAICVSVPVACAFVATLWARRGESLAVAQLGLSPWFAEGPMLVACALVMALVAVAAHEGIPRVVSLRNALVQQAQLRSRDALSSAYVEPPTWFFLPERLLFVPAQHRLPNEQTPRQAGALCFVDPIVYGWRDGHIESVTQARALGAEGNTLWLYGAVTHFVDSPARQKHEKMALPQAFLPANLTQLLGNPSELPTRALRALILRREAARLPSATHRWELASRSGTAAAGWASLVMVAPYILSLDRRRTLARNVAYAALSAASALVAMQVARCVAMASMCSYAWASLLPAGTLLGVRLVLRIVGR